MLTKVRVSNFSFRIVNKVFEIYDNVLSKNGLEKAPSGIFNLDEVGLAQNVSIATSSCKFDVLKIMTGNRVDVKYAEKNSIKNLLDRLLAWKRKIL